MPNVVKIIIKDKFTNKLIALKLKEETPLKRVVEILSKRYEHLKNREVSLALRGDELAQEMSLKNLISEKGYTEKERIEISEKKTLSQAPATPEPQDFIRMMSEGGDKFDQAICEILVQANALHKSSAKSAMDMAKQRNCSIITTLIEDAYLTEKDILTNISRFLEIPSVDLDGITIANEVTDLIPEKEAEYYCVIPIRMERNTLCIAMPNPFDSKKLHDLRLLTGLDIEPELSTEITIRSKIKQFYQAPIEKAEIAPEESPLPEELFSVSSQPKKKSTLMIKEGKIVDSQEVEEEEYEAPTLCGDKSEEFMPVEPEAESTELESQEESPQADEIWEAPTLVGRRGETSPIEAVTLMPESQDLGIAIPIEDPVDNVAPEITQEEPVSRDDMSPGGEIPVFAGFHPDEIPEAIEIVAGEQDAGSEEEEEKEDLGTDLMKTERLKVSPDLSVPAVLQDEEQLLQKELEKELGISQEELELEKAVRTERIDPEMVPPIIFKAEPAGEPSLFDSGEEDAQKITEIEIEGAQKIEPDASEDLLQLPQERDVSKEEIDAPEAESAELSLESPQGIDLSNESSTIAKEEPSMDLSAKEESEPEEPVADPEELKSDSVIEAKGRNESEEEPDEDERSTEPKQNIENLPQMPKTMAIAKQGASSLDSEPAKPQESGKPDIDFTDMVATRKMSKTGEVISESTAKSDAGKISRQLSARHYRKMYPFRSFPLWVIFSKAKLAENFSPEVVQVKGEQIDLDKRDTLVRVVPCIPGCLSVPREALVDVAPDNATAKIWITPLSEGKIEDGKIEIWSGNKCLQTLSVSMDVVKQWPAKFAMILGVVTPLLAFFYDFFGASRINDYPYLLQKFLLFLQKCAVPLQGMFNLGLTVGGGLIFVALLLFFTRMARKAEPVTAELEFSG